MKSRFIASRIMVVGALGVFTACDAGNDKSSEPQSDLGETTLMLRGSNAEDLRTVPVTLREVTVTADGVVLPVQIEGDTLDLAQRRDYEAARFTVPAGANIVRVTVRLDDYGGYEGRDGRAGTLDARGTSLSMEIPASALAKSGRAQMSLDLARSLVDVARDKSMFSPHFEVTY